MGHLLEGAAAPLPHPGSLPRTTGEYTSVSTAPRRLTSTEWVHNPQKAPLNPPSVFLLWWQPTAAPVGASLT